MFEARSRGWFICEYDIVGTNFQSVELGKVNDYWLETYYLRVDSRRFKLSRKSPFNNEFTMYEDGELVAKADKKGIMSNSFDFELSGTHYSLIKQIRLMPHFELFKDGKQPSKSTIIQNGFFSSTLIVDLPDEISIEHQFFITWLAIILLGISKSG